MIRQSQSGEQGGGFSGGGSARTWKENQTAIAPTTATEEGDGPHGPSSASDDGSGTAAISDTISHPAFVFGGWTIEF